MELECVREMDIFKKENLSGSSQRVFCDDAPEALLPSSSTSSSETTTSNTIVYKPIGSVDEILSNRLYLTSAIGLRHLRPHATKPTHIVTVMDYDYLKCTKLARLKDYTWTFIKADDKSDEDLYQHFESITNEMNDMIESGAIVYVHCMMGVSRSATLVLAYLIRHLRWSLSEAMVHVKQCRSRVDPNDGFVKQLQQWEKWCRHTTEEYNMV